MEMQFTGVFQHSEEAGTVAWEEEMSCVNTQGRTLAEDPLNNTQGSSEAAIIIP